mgnify:CR=1 FL=1
MNTAKVFKSGNSQAVRLPKEFNFEQDEVLIKKIGSMVLLIPKDDSWRMFTESLDRFTPDFMQTRAQPPLDDREGL